MPAVEVPLRRRPGMVRLPLILAAVAICLGALLPIATPGVALGFTGGMIVITAGLARRRRILANLLYPLVFLGVGWSAAALELPPHETVLDTLGPAALTPVFLEGVLHEGPEERPDRTRLYVDLVGTATAPGARILPVEGRLRLDLYGRAKEVPLAGDWVRVWARPRALDDAGFPGGTTRRALAARRGVSLVASAPPEHLVVIRSGGGLGVIAERLRTRVHHTIDRALPPGPASLVRAFATGDRSAIPDELDQAFQASGLSHLLAVSGLNLAIVAGIFVFLLGAVLKRSEVIALGFSVRRSAALLAMPAVVFYTFLVGASPSAVRSALMVLALLVGQLSARLRETWSALALAVIVMVAWDPATLGDVSFQLSFAAVAGLLRLQPALMTLVPDRVRTAPTWQRWPVDIFLATVAATVGTMPLVGRHFGRVAWAGLLANLPAGPLSSLVLVPLSLLGGLLGTVSATLAQPILWLAGGAAEALAWLAQAFAGLPGASFEIPQPTILECVLFYGITFGLAAGLAEVPDGPVALSGGPTRVAGAKRRRALGFAAACAIAILLSYAGGQWARRHTQDATWVQLPVGQGDAAVLELPEGRTVLVDVGPPGDAAERVILAYLRHRRIPRIDLVVLTHPHADHVGGLPTLAAAIPIGEVWWNGDRRESTDVLLQPLAQLPNRIVTASTTPYRAGEAILRVLSPRRSPEGYATVNDASVVLSLEVHGQRVLLMGDAEADAEAQLVASGIPLQAVAVKLGHHGSRTSSTEPFLAKAQPEWAVYSLGAGNHFGFPSRIVDERLKRMGVQVARTDRGAVIGKLSKLGLEVTGAGVGVPDRSRPPTPTSP
jgi:competence protein ComEC